MKLTRRHVGEFFWMVVGVGLQAVGVHCFRFPNHFSVGGVAGLGVVLGAAVPGLSPSTAVSALNLIFLVLGFVFLRRAFGVKTTFCSLLLSGLLELLDFLWPITQPLTDQPFLELFFAVLIPAVGSGILFNLNASTGGTDVAALILHKYTALDTGRALLCTDFLIAGSTFFLFDTTTALFSIFGLVLKSYFVDAVIEALNRRKSFTVITTHPGEVNDFITRTLGRSATVWHAEGAYTGQSESVILCALTQHQAMELRKRVREVDPHAFLLVTNSSEIFGKGFLST